ncbi:alpha/beta fold hydrolase [Nonomuraea sp. ATR24]|uniref:alpha/beta fold hydrolase n=1 Tax=unclassified Nonomuraea TaxID=2593643 RepID=UPI0034087839
MGDRAGLAVRVFTPDRAADAPPVLLVHGFGSDGGRDWAETGIAGALTAAGRVVVAPDLPGHGDSPAPASPAGAGAKAVAAALVTALDQALAGVPAPAGGAFDAFDVVGYSLGARLAWELPEVAPGRVRRAVLGGLSPVEPFAAVDVAALRRAVAGEGEPADPLTSAIAGLARAAGERAAGLALCVEGLRDTPFEPRAWGGERPPVFVVGKDDVMSDGIGRIVELAGATEPVTVPGDHFQALAGAGFRDAVLRVLLQ